MFTMQSTMNFCHQSRTGSKGQNGKCPCGEPATHGLMCRIGLLPSCCEHCATEREAETGCQKISFHSFYQPCDKCESVVALPEYPTIGEWSTKRRCIKCFCACVSLLHEDMAKGYIDAVSLCVAIAANTASIQALELILSEFMHKLRAHGQNTQEMFNPCVSAWSDKICDESTTIDSCPKSTGAFEAADAAYMKSCAQHLANHKQMVQVREKMRHLYGIRENLLDKVKTQIMASRRRKA